MDLSFDQPREGRRDGNNAAGVLLAVIGLGSLEDCSLMSGAPDLEHLPVEVCSP